MDAGEREKSIDVTKSQDNIIIHKTCEVPLGGHTESLASYLDQMPLTLSCSTKDIKSMGIFRVIDAVARPIK